MIERLRKLYRGFVRSPALDRAIYAVLDCLTNLLARCKRFSFPANYIRRWKLNMLWGLYEPETYALFKTVVSPGMTVVDIGAHIGYFTRLFSRRVGPSGRVYAFEADPVNFALLLKNTEHRKNIIPVERAVSERAGSIDFYHYDDKSGAHSTLPNVPLDFRKRKITVSAVTLDAWLAEKGISRVDVIKMDIEGGESAALRGMAKTLAGAKTLVTEFAPAWIEAAGSAPVGFLQIIERHGFEIFAITDRGLVKLSPVFDENFLSLLPQPKDTHASEFINLYCVRTHSTK